MGSFREEDLAVHNDDQEPRLDVPRPKDSLGGLVAFGANADGGNGITASLGKRVREFYRQQGLKYLHEIRVYEAATGQLPDGLYHLFWNNQETLETMPSDEMALLLRHFARPRREGLGQLWRTRGRYLLDEYEFEYGDFHPPFNPPDAPRRTRAEILHPLFIQRPPSAILRIGQLSDTHVDVRADVYEENLKLSGGAVAYNSYQNWNKSFVRTYQDAKRDSDVLFLTGDLIDYGRGHWGVEKRQELGQDNLYQPDRNWFLFYHLLASGDAYQRPAYTILGNHDWRLNPYPPFATAGAPKPPTMFPDAVGFAPGEQKSALEKAHGPGYQRAISYNDAVETKYRIALSNWRQLGWQVLLKVFGGDKTLDAPGLPTETTVESVAWYLMSINPFLDYRFTLPAGHGVLMLDWAENENLFFGSIFQGKRFGSLDRSSGDEGPTARDCLSDLQVALVKQFTEAPGVAKIIGIHAPPIGPWHDWDDAELARGWKSLNLGGRGYPHYSFKAADGRTIKGHPLFAIRPAKGVIPDAVHGMDASYNSFERHRPWFIKRVGDPRSGVRLVLSGHIHRRSLFVAYPATEATGPAVAGEMLIRSVLEKDARGVRAPTGAHLKVRTNTGELGFAPGPLYVNATSVGPRGHFIPAPRVHHYLDPGYTHIELANDGTILQVMSRWVRGPQTTAPPPRAIAAVV
jgi:predicted MPP superfamily phosphohydrolase